MKDHKPLNKLWKEVEAGFVFALLDNKDIEDRVWKLVLERVREDA